ncbi:TPA: DUF4435 domain-containing protein [Proteus mirabilis]|uniref:DUF4435 domain-containing protein n=1 Tax=Proteus mirabilis TaxID=584 RepID=UPI0029EE2200|nr:DUF4435 domain-containing protein [Proteus mirabilis]
MSDDLLKKMKNEISSKNPLKQAILLKTSKYEKIYIFEGVDDYPVYDEWMKRNEVYRRSAHLVAKGKKQILKLYNHSIEIEDYVFLKKCFFFVDHDYDLYDHNDDYIRTLNCYSIENYIVNEESLISCLKDEMRIDIKNDDVLEKIISQFKIDFNKFIEISRGFCKVLFSNYNTEEKTKYYKKVTSFCNIEYGNVTVKDNIEIINYAKDIDSKEVIHFIGKYEELSDDRAVIGKYVFDFFKIWLSTLKIHLNANVVNLDNITKDPLMIERRRLAGAVKPPLELANFI